VRAIARRAYQTKSTDQIRGSGYVVESLEAALWCFDTTDSFEAAILQAANLGDDADTTAAICGQIAGAFYGESGIPSHWLGHLVKAAAIRKFADRLWHIGSDGSDGIDVDADADDSDILQRVLSSDGLQATPHAASKDAP
jgi:ADP-ribosyl-[dinitrogen reductase] hydrolase